MTLEVSIRQSTSEGPQGLPVPSAPRVDAESEQREGAWAFLHLAHNKKMGSVKATSAYALGLKLHVRSVKAALTYSLGLKLGVRVLLLVGRVLLYFLDGG